jgi:MFS superfamily sulfate permease-like transporter
MKMLKIIGIVVGTIVIIAAAAFFFISRIVFPQAPSFQDMIKVFERNRESIQQIADKFQMLDFDTIIIFGTSEDYRYVRVVGNSSAISYAYNDDRIFDAFQLLFNEQNCEVIQKDENYISFQWWNTLDASCGIVYSLDGRTPRMNEESAEVIEQSFESIGYENWYYYTYKWLGSQHS